MKTVLTIAGSDSSGGAGIQADIKTIEFNGVYATCAITALTAQNTLGVKDIFRVPPKFLEEQLDAVFEDIPPDAVKIGMISSAELVFSAAKKLRQYNAAHIVVDPVMVATSGASLTGGEAVKALVDEIFPLAEIVTPNIREAEALSKTTIRGKDDMFTAARIIAARSGCAVLLKGGHSVADADDLLVQGDSAVWLEGKRVDNPNNHGTGCTLSSAIAANLAKGFCLKEAVARAKEYISAALNAMLDLGKGSGPLDHAFDLSGKFAEGR